MGSKIEIVKLVQPLPILRQGYISCAVEAARSCINHNVEADQIGILVSTAIYRDHHLVEPALSSLILGKVMQNPLLKKGSPHGQLQKVITFDLNNGACGLIQAIQLVDTYIQNGNVKRGMIITGDSTYNKRNNNNYPFSDGAAAIILSKGVKNMGFSGFQTDSYLQFKDDFTGICQYRNRKLYLNINEKDQFLEHAVTCVMSSMEKFLEKEKISISDIDFVFSTQNPDGLISQIREKTNLGNKVIQLDSKINRFHTAAPLAALDKLIKSSQYGLAKNILFLAVGSGITVSLALYKQ